MSVSLVLPAVPEEEDDDGDVDVITIDAFSIHPVIEAKSAAVPSSIMTPLFALFVRCGRGARGLVLSILCGFSAGSYGT
jgi:hypothetical protein